MRAVIFSIFLVCGVFNNSPSMAWEPSEVLNDAKLETRARKLSAELRCLVCQNQSIDDSSAELAKKFGFFLMKKIFFVKFDISHNFHTPLSFQIFSA